MPKYYWMATLIILVLFTAYFGIQAWHYVNQPVLLDMFWNETLKMYEPIYAPRSPEFITVWFVPVAMFTIWWHSPLYIFIPFNLFMGWCALLIIAYRPCISLR